jgi:hypothetical protein
MPHRHLRRPLTEAEIAEIRRHGPGFWVFKRAKDDRKQTPIGRYIACVIALVIVVGWGFLLYRGMISEPAFIASAAQLIGR